MLDLDHTWKPVCKSRAPARWHGKKMSNAPKEMGQSASSAQNMGTLTQPAKDRDRPSHWEALPTL